MVVRPLELIVNELIQEIQAVLPDVNTLPGSALREAFINPPAAQISFLSEAIENVRIAQTVAEATGTSLDRLASNFGLTREVGRTAVGEIVLVFSTSINNLDIVVPDGSSVTTDERINTVEFSVIGTHTFRPIDRDFFAAEATRLRDRLRTAGITDAEHVATVPIQAFRSGSLGNVGALAIVRGNIPGVRALVNLSPTVGGTDVESDASLRRRISLALASSSRGTEEGLIAIALANPIVTAALVVRPGDPLMTRDGSVFDEEGNLVKAGTGRAVDVYVKGVQPITNTETFTFADNSEGESISVENNLILGFDEISTNNVFAKQPVVDILGLTGSVSGANFKRATEVRDSEGNVILDGNFVLLKDIEQENSLTIVKDNETGETRVATFISPTSTRFSVIEKLTSSGRGNSALGLDSVFFLTNVSSIEDEVVTRGPEFNGSDSLALANVAQIKEIDEEVVLTKESILISNQNIDVDAFIVFTKHKPVVDITEVRHARLGFNYDFELLDADEGKIQLIGRFVPQADDVIQVSYTWRQKHIQNVEFFLQGDTVKWSREPFERSQVTGLTLLEPTTLTSSLDLQVQPLVPTYLGLQVNQLTARARYNMTVNGNKARIVRDEKVTFDSAPSFSTEDFLFGVRIPQSATASSSRLGRVINVRNLSKGFEYSIENMALNTNVFDPSVRVEQALSDNEFLLDSVLNTRNLEVGDKLILSRKSLLKHWTTTEDFTNNLSGQVAPTFDSITTNISNDEITIKRQEDDADSPGTILSGPILQSGILSGIVEIADDVTIESGVTVIIQPNTVIRFRDAASLDTTKVVQELVELDNTVTDVDIDSATNIDENAYIFERPVGTTSPFFIILNDSGTETFSIFFDRDVIRQVVTARDGSGLPTAFDYFINDRLVSVEFLGGPTDSGLIAAIETSGIFLGYRRDNGDGTSTFVSRSTLINGRSQYGVPLTETPRTTGITADDFSFFQSSNPNATFSDVAYDSERNVFLVDGLAIEAGYEVEYFKSIIKRLSLKVRGTLQVSADVDENNPIVFTSTSENPSPGDWEGIIFEPSSHTNAPGNAFNTSFLIHCTIKNARIGIQNNTSDPFIDRCLIKNNLEGGYSVTSSFFQIQGFTNDNFRLLSNDFAETGRSYAEERFGGDGYGYGYGYGYSAPTSTRTLSLPIDDLLTTAAGNIPQFTKVGVTTFPTSDTLDVINFAAKYLVEFVSGVDFQVLVDGVPLTPGVDADFAIEYDRTRGGFLLSFFNTQLTLDFLAANLSSPNVVTLDYYAVFDNGAINNSIFTKNGNSAIDIDKTASLAIINNTMHENGLYGVTIDNSYAVMRNNLVTEFDIAPILQRDTGVLDATTNNMWSLPVVTLEQTEIAEVDKLVLDVTEEDTIFTVATPSLYSRNTVFKIDNEFVQVQDILGDRLSVVRGFNNTTPVEHSTGTDIFIQRVKTIFTVTGIPGNFCQVRETTSDGTLITGREPVTMLKIADNTFRVSFSVDRSATFHYRYQFKQDLAEPQWTLTNVRRLTVDQFGSTVNNFVNPNHEVAISVTPFGSIDTTNYSDNPLFEQPEFENFRIPDNSPASANNPIYATPFDPSETRLRFLGQRPVLQIVSLSSGTASIILDFTPIVVTSLQTDVTIQLASNTNRKLVAGTYDDATKTLTLSAPVTSSDVGTYQILYNTPITLGTTLSPFPLITVVTYQFNENRVVDWTKLNWTESGDSGNVSARFRIANDPGDLASVAFSNSVDEPPFDLSFGTSTFPRGSVIEFEITLETNDAGFAPDGTPLFPRLQDVTLFLTPAKDNVLYKVLDTSFDTKTQKTVVTIEDDENEGLGIRSSTFVTIGSGDALSAIVRKASDGFEESLEFVIGETDAVVAGDTVLNIKGNIILQRTAPEPDDEVVADLIFVDLNDSEDVVFIENGTQVTQDLFFSVNNVTTQVVIDKAPSTLATEVLSISALDQPAPGAQYLTTYTFTAPLEGETLTVSYTYNDVIRTVAQAVEAERTLTSDILVRAAVEVPVRIEANVLIDSGFSANAVVIDIANALQTFFAAQSTFGGTILSTDVGATMASVSGVTSVGLNVLSRTSEAVVNDIVLTAREFAVVAPNNPLLTIALASNPTQILSTNSV
jgi:uncharacterized phage protein gp47/JayE